MSVSLPLPSSDQLKSEKKGPDDRSLTAGRAQQWKITPIKDLTNQHYLLVTSNTIVTATEPTVLGENGGLNSPVVRIRRA
jgi:hypothetical protein